MPPSQGKKRGELVRSLLASYCGTLPPTQGLCAGTGVWETRKGIRARPGPVRAGCHWWAHGMWSTEVTHGAVDSQGEQHDKENHGPDGGQRERGKRLGVDDEDQPRP